MTLRLQKYQYLKKNIACKRADISPECKLLPPLTHNTRDVLSTLLAFEGWEGEGYGKEVMVSASGSLTHSVKDSAISYRFSVVSLRSSQPIYAVALPRYTYHFI